MKFRKFTKSKTDQEGFTLTEILVVLPIASVILVTLAAALFVLYTSALAESARSNLRSNGQTLLINLQDELLFTIAYGEGLDSNLTDAFEPTGGWTYNTSPDTLIINEVALDSTRRNDDRNIVRQRINDCESSSVTSNPVAINNIIYFVVDNPNSDYDTLYKRTITPTYNLCGIDSTTGNPCTPITSTCAGNAKVTSCPIGQLGAPNCGDEDSILSEDVIDLQLTYFAENNVVTTFPSAADKIEIVLTLGSKVFGKTIQTEVKHTIRKIN